MFSVVIYFKLHMLCAAPLYSREWWQWSLFLQYFLSFKYRFFHCRMILAALLLITSLFFFLSLIIFIVCSLKDSQNFFIQSLPMHTCFFSMLLNDDIVDIKKPDGICSLIFVVDEFLGFFLLPSIFSIKHPRST